MYFCFKLNLRFITDKFYYRNDVRANVSEVCNPEPERDFVTFNDNCTVHILKMCNGLMHCDDCADEQFDACKTKQCSDGAFTAS